LVELARLEAGRELRNLSPFDAAALVRDTCNMFQPGAVERRLFLRVDVPPALPVNGDHVKVQRIIQNLLLNALKYTEQGGIQVSVTSASSNVVPSWELQIQDTGVGMADRSSPAIARVLRSASQELHSQAAVVDDLEAPPTLPSLSSRVPRALGEG